MRLDHEVGIVQSSPVGTHSLKPSSAWGTRIVALLALLLMCQCASGAETASARVLPLNRFENSRRDQPAGKAYRLAVGVADDYFDGTSSKERVRRHFAIAGELGVKYLRCAFSWNAIEKSPGKYDWSFWDNLVEEAHKADVELIPYVAYTPAWAAEKQQEFWAQPPRDTAVYADFMRRIVSRYRGKIKAWEIWNEPDNREYWQGPVASYAALVKAAAKEMRRADPGIVLVLGGMSRGPGQFFRALLSDYGIAGYVDVIAMHAYPESWDQERAEVIFQDWAQQMAEMVEHEGSGADFWINEMGYADYRFSPNQASKWGISVYYNYEHTPDYQARFLFKSEVMSLASPRVSLTAWYRIDDLSPEKNQFSDDLVNYHLGLMDTNEQPKPAFFALRFFQQLFGEPTVRMNGRGTLPPDSQAVLEAFRTANGQIIVTGWLRSSRDAEVTQRGGTAQDERKEVVSFPLPCKTAPEVHSYDVEGHTTPSPAVAHGFLRGIKLTGQDVFVATVTCR